jgi:purine-cytosine permease-like protein
MYPLRLTGSAAMNNNNTTYIETRSIEPIPDGERHGSIFSQFTLWLGLTCKSPPWSLAH